MMFRVARTMTLWIVGGIWALAGVSKLVELFADSTGGLQEATWVSSFPSGLMIGIALLECAVGVLVFAGKQWVAILLGSSLLSAFIVALWIWPMDYQQSCGCFGEIPLLDEIDPMAKIIFFAGFHVLAAAMLWNGRIKTASRDAVAG